MKPPQNEDPSSKSFSWVHADQILQALMEDDVFQERLTVDCSLQENLLEFLHRTRYTLINNLQQNETPISIEESLQISCVIGDGPENVSKASLANAPGLGSEEEKFNDYIQRTIGILFLIHGSDVMHENKLIAENLIEHIFDNDIAQILLKDCTQDPSSWEFSHPNFIHFCALMKFCTKSTIEEVNLRIIITTYRLVFTTPVADIMVQTRLLAILVEALTRSKFPDSPLYPSFVADTLDDWLLLLVSERKKRTNEEEIIRSGALEVLARLLAPLPSMYLRYNSGDSTRISNINREIIHQHGTNFRYPNHEARSNEVDKENSCFDENKFSEDLRKKHLERIGQGWSEK